MNFIKTSNFECHFSISRGEKMFEKIEGKFYILKVLKLLNFR